jgi:hypothetical protein
MIRALTLVAGAVVALADAGLTFAGERTGRPQDPMAETFAAAEVIRQELGSKRTVGYFVNVNGNCRVTFVVAEAPRIGEAEPAPARITMSLRPGEQADLAGDNGDGLILSCGKDAKTIRVVRAGQARL